jgi:hypothetical protein
VEQEDGSIVKHLDSGCVFGTQTCMNPLNKILEEFCETLHPSSDTVTVFFLSNGWVRLGEPWISDRKLPRRVKSNPHLQVNIFNLDIDMNEVFKNWKKKTILGRICSRISNEDILLNMAGSGAVSIGMFNRTCQKDSKRFTDF